MKFNLVEVFSTIQGEGANAGRAALFIRMPYCNLACSWCDTQFDKYTEWDEEDLRYVLTQTKTRFAVITGGEPTMHKHTRLVVQLLQSCGYDIAIETNGTFPIPVGIDFVTVSPKREQKVPYYVDAHAMQRASEFKYVVDDAFDWEVLKRHNTDDGRRYSLSPEWGARESSMAKIVDFVKENPDWRISLQTHKILNVR